MYYIYENDKPKFLEQKFNIIKIKGNKIILPNGDKTDKQLEKLAQKTIKIMQNVNNKKIVLSKELQKKEKYINILQSYPLEIIDGKWLYFMLLPEILEYILQGQNMKKEETIIHILVNDINENMIQLLNLLTKTYKSICVVTKHVQKLQKIEQQILDETGTVITVMNNKKKSLSKAKIIVNIDFPEEFVNQYIIYENAVILDIQGNTKIRKKRYNGIILQNYEINIKRKEEYEIEEELFYVRDLYEAEFYKKQPYQFVREKIKKDGIKIASVYGKNGNFERVNHNEKIS